MTTTLDRRGLLGGLGAAWAASARAGPQAAANQWFALVGDDGHPVPNLRAPAELVDEIADLPGAIWAGPRPAAVELVEFYDYNCPWCRAADAARDALRRDHPDLRVGIVNNPILSPASAAAARVDLAVLSLRGAGASYGLHRRLFAGAGRIDGERALDAAASLGLPRDELATLAETAPIRQRLLQQMGLAASLGIAATPSYVVAGAVLLGYPGPNALGGIVAAARRCGAVVC